MRNNNIWNRLFHNSEIKENKEQMRIYVQKCTLGPNIINAIKEVKNLYTLLEIHKTAWGANFRNINLAPCSYGFFRTNDILKMLPNEVYLGDIYGLFTQNIQFWEKHKDDKYDVNEFGISKDTLIYDLIVDQYKNILLSNIKSMLNIAKDRYCIYKKAGY